MQKLKNETWENYSNTEFGMILKFLYKCYYR